MKKSLLALAVLGAFAGAAAAQSSVTIYGKLDQGFGKKIGSEDKTLLDAAGSRLGFKGVEDLGGGLAATFGMEHRFTPSSGAANANFWQGYSTVGLQGSFGHVRIGRDYSVAFLMAQNQIDPFGGDTVAGLRDTGMRAGGLGVVRFGTQAEYHFSAAGFNFGAQIADASANSADGDAKNGYALAANYAAGPLFVGIGFENGVDADDDLLSIGARYNFGFATLSAGYSKGTSVAGNDQKGAIIGANIPVGAGDFKIGYAKASDDLANKWGIGYHYNLSKRTKLYADYARDSKAIGPKTGYDLGIQHNF